MSKDGKKGLGYYLQYGLLVALSRTVSALPYCVQYGVLMPFICFILRKTGYRRYIIRRQLRDSFPQKSEQERLRIEKECYSTLAENIVNTIILISLDTQQKRSKRMRWSDWEQVDQVVGENDAVVLTSHLGFWEFYLTAITPFPGRQILAAYHGLKNRAFDDFFLRLRTFERCIPVESAMYMRSYLDLRADSLRKPVLLGLISDQNSPPHRDSVWFDFLNHKSLIFDGGEKLALKYKLPVFYATMVRVRPGYYDAHFELIWDGEESVAPHEITRRYAQKLERDIQNHPELWMWSHNRWKWVPDPQTGKAIYRNVNSCRHTEL